MPTVARSDVERQAAAWAASGAMALTGRSEGPALGAPAGLVVGIESFGDRIAATSAELGGRVTLDWLALLGERAALRDLRRAGDRSCGGSTWLLPAADGWVAVALARPEDVELLPAWLGVPPLDDQPAEARWSAVAEAVAARSTSDLAAGAALLSLPCGALGERTGDESGAVVASALGPAAETRDASALVVLDLSSLWAGPLAASLLGQAGAKVIKVESPRRPDAARRGDPVLFDLLHAGQLNVSVDLTTGEGRARLARLVAHADVVVESARPRALEQFGIVAADVLAAPQGPRVWLSITGHGRASPRVAFGDDAAVAGGLVVADDAGPCFVADAVADPIAGLAAAAAVLEALVRGGRWLVDVAMAGAAASLAGPALPAAGQVAPPRARPPTGTARPLGADDATVLGAL